MAETVRIEIPIETIDETAAGLNAAIQGLGKLEQAYRNASQSAHQADQNVSQFDKQAQKTEKTLASWMKEKYEILLKAKETVTPVLSTIGNGLKSFAGKTWNVTVRAIDRITSPVRGMINLLKNPVFQAGAVLGVSIGLKDTIDTYKDFEAAMSQVKAISGATDSDFEKLTEKAREMGTTTKFTAAEAAEGFHYMAMAGWKTEDMLGGIEGILNLAAASGESLGTTSDIVTDALTAFGMNADEAGHFADVMAAASSNANTNVSLMGETFKYAGAMAGTLKYSIEDVALATGLMANAGIKGNMAGTALNSIFTRLSTNTNGATDALKKLGIEYFNSDGSARAFADIMKELRVATADFTDKQKAQLANTVAGTYAQKGFLAILNATTEDYDKLSNAVTHADGAAEDMADTMLDNLQGSITLLQSAVDGVKISFGERLSPYVRSLADWLTAQMPAVEQGLDEFMDWLDTKVDRMKRKFSEISSTDEWQNADFFGKVQIAWDEFIVEPFSEWWNGTGKATFAGFAQDIGEGIGTGLKIGVMTLLGIDLEETVDEGMSIGASFAKGFSEGFDISTIFENLSKGLSGMVSSAGKLFPGGETAGLSSILSAVVLGKAGKMVFDVGSMGARIGKSLFAPNAATGISFMSALIGSTGNAMVSGSGILGKLASAGYAIGDAPRAGLYFGDMTGSMSGGTAALAGAAGIGGTIAAGATLVSSVLDAYKAMKSDNEEESNVYGESAAWKAGGVAAGAAIGSIIPGIGTVVGALVGAGVGGIAGWIKGNKVKKEYQENVEEMQKEAEQAQKVFEVTGLSIEEVGFQNEDLMRAMNDSEISASQFALMFQEECANVAKKAFGDISLSLAEVKKVASEITFAGMAEELSEFAKATADTETALNHLQSSVIGLKKENGKVGLGMELSETDKDGYKSAIESFLSTSQTFINDNHYQAKVALKLLAGGEADTSGLDSYYGELKSQIENLGAELTDSMNLALEDSVITLDEAAELESLQNQISKITNKLTEAKTDAEMQALKIKYNGAALDMDSFNALQEELQANVASASEQYESALKLTITNLNLQLSDEAITQSEYDRAVAEATEQYYVQINQLNARAGSFNLDTIATAWDAQLEGMLPDLEGRTRRKLTRAMENAITINPDIETWTQEDVKRWFGLDALAVSDGASFEVIYQQLLQTAFTVPEDTKKRMIENFQNSLPDAGELMEGIDWTEITNQGLEDMVNDLIPGYYSGQHLSAANDLWDGNALVSNQVNFDALKEHISQKLASALQESTDRERIQQWLGEYYTGVAQEMQKLDFSAVLSQYGPISNENYTQMVSEWLDAGTTYGAALNRGASESLLSGSLLFRTGLQTALDTATASPFTISPAVNVTPAYKIIKPNFPDFSQNISGHATGGYVSGGPQLSWLAEEGYGEFIIPTNPSRRARALDLYAQAGAALGVSVHADGGYVGGSILSDMVSNYNLFHHGNRSVPLTYNETTEGNYSGETAKTYEPASVETAGTASSTPIQVNVKVSPEFVIHKEDEQSEENIMQVIKRHMKEMADELGGEIAEKLEEVFSNMPLKEVSL